MYEHTKEKKLYVWGYNNNGQLEYRKYYNQNTPQEVTTVTFDGTGVGEIKKVQMLNRSSDLSVGILTERGTLYFAGYNSEVKLLWKW